MLDLHTIDFINYAVNHAVRPCAQVRHDGYCTADYAPALVGDCKQYAAVKLRELLLAGAEPGEFVIWITQIPGQARTHAVLVHTPDGLVLDSVTNVVEPRAFKERYEGLAFVRPCERCGEPARADAAAIRQREAAR